MKLPLFFILVLTVVGSFAQNGEFVLQGQLVDANKQPISDAYIINFRNSDKNTSRTNGVFDVRVLPTDSLIFSHVSFFRKVVSVFELLRNPQVEMVRDTVNIMQIDVSPEQMTDAERALENIKSLDFDFRPQPGDNYTQSERMTDLLNTENRVQRAASNSLDLLRFSPSEEIGKLIDKVKRRKKARQFDSTRKNGKKK